LEPITLEDCSPGLPVLPNEYLDLSRCVVPKTFGKTRLKMERMAGIQAQMMPTGTSMVDQ